jgi:hypothetical protein
MALVQGVMQIRFFRREFAHVACARNPEPLDQSLISIDRPEGHRVKVYWYWLMTTYTCCSLVQQNGPLSSAQQVSNMVMKLFSNVHDPSAVSSTSLRDIYNWSNNSFLGETKLTKAKKRKMSNVQTQQDNSLTQHWNAARTKFKTLISFYVLSFEQSVLPELGAKSSPKKRARG